MRLNSLSSTILAITSWHVEQGVMYCYVLVECFVYCNRTESHTSALFILHFVLYPSSLSLFIHKNNENEKEKAHHSGYRLDSVTVLCTRLFKTFHCVLLVILLYLELLWWYLIMIAIITSFFWFVA